MLLENYAREIWANYERDNSFKKYFYRIQHSLFL